MVPGSFMFVLVMSISTFVSVHRCEYPHKHRLFPWHLPPHVSPQTSPERKMGTSQKGKGGKHKGPKKLLSNYRNMMNDKDKLSKLTAGTCSCWLFVSALHTVVHCVQVSSDVLWCITLVHSPYCLLPCWFWFPRGDFSVFAPWIITFSICPLYA